MTTGPVTEIERRDGLAIHHRPVAGAPRVVLVHGAMDRAGGFVKALRRLSHLDLLRYDRRGYGQSRHGHPHGHAPTAIAGTVEAHVDDLFTVLGDEPAIVVGHSLGGVIALAAAGRRPDLVPSVAAFEAPMPWLDWWPVRTPGNDARRSVAGGAISPEDAAEQFLRRMIGDTLWERFPRSMQEGRRAEGHALVAELRDLRNAGDLVRLADLAMPVLAGCGSVSKPHHRRAARELAATAPDGELFEIAGAEHGAHYTHPDDFARFVNRAVERAR